MATGGVATLVALGISKQKALYALKEHGNDVDAAADWCYTDGADWTPQSLLSTTYRPPVQDTSSTVESPELTLSGRSSAARSYVPPRRSAIQPGTPVSIILKADQPTGRQVQGIVAECLTRADHPRGVKVRLVDGRVGRVQSITL